MFKDIIIGQYVPGNSPLHKMNPPVKIIMTILYIVLLFILKNPISYVVFTIYTVTLILISGVPFKMILKGLKPMLWIFIFTAVLNVFMTPGDTVWALKIFKFTLKITKEGIESGSLMVKAFVSCNGNVTSYAYNVTFTAYGRNRKTVKTFQ